MKVIEMNIKEEGTLYDLIDAQHLLFTGDAYTPVGIYVLEQVWVEGGEGHYEKVRTSFWKNETGDAIPGWGGTFRFGMDGKDANNECIATFDEATWNILKTEPFRIAIEPTVDYPNIRITTGWWSTDYPSKEHNCFEEVEEDENGVLFMEINLSLAEALQAAVDEQHLLFTGDGYKLLEIYQEKEVWVEEDAAPKPIVFWENTDDTPIPGWGGTFRFALDGNDANNDCIATFDAKTWEAIKEGVFYAVYDGNEGSNVRITTGWWSAAYGGTEHNCIDMAEDTADGLKSIKIDIKKDGNLYDKIDVEHLLFTGDAYTLKKLFYYPNNK